MPLDHDETLANGQYRILRLLGRGGRRTDLTGLTNLSGLYRFNPIHTISNLEEP
jgi:hypothetical protein